MPQKGWLALGKVQKKRGSKAHRTGCLHPEWVLEKPLAEGERGPGPSGVREGSRVGQSLEVTGASGGEPSQAQALSLGSGSQQATSAYV